MIDNAESNPEESIPEESIPEVRSFIAIPLDSALADRISSLCAHWRVSRIYDYRQWVALPNLHLTLAFLGNQSLQSLFEIQKPLQTALSQRRAFSVVATQLGAFPDAKSAILALEFAPGSELLSLKQRIDDVLLAGGFPVESRPFRPHVTLARKPVKPQRKKLQTELPELSLQVDAVNLYQSEQSPAGVQYRPLFEIKL